MIRAMEAKPGFDAQPVKKDHDLLSTLYREIGISAVAAALEVTKAAGYTTSQDNEDYVVRKERNCFEKK